MNAYEYDLFVIGGGSGGVRAARVAASLGMRVGIAEEYRFGRTCVIRGCVPKKLFVYASQYRERFEDATGYGWTVDEEEAGRRYADIEVYRAEFRPMKATHSSHLEKTISRRES